MSAADDSAQANCKWNVFRSTREFLAPRLQNVWSFQSKILRGYVADKVFKEIKFVITPAVEVHRKMPRLMTASTLNIEHEELRIGSPGSLHDHAPMLTVGRGEVLAVDYSAIVLEDYQTTLYTIPGRDARA